MNTRKIKPTEGFFFKRERDGQNTISVTLTQATPMNC